MSHDRRNFLKSVGTGAAAAVAVTKITENSAQAAGQNFQTLAASVGRTDSQIKLALELDGEFAAWLSHFEGGQAAGIVVEHKDQTGQIRKHIGGVKYEDITVKMGTGMSKAVYQWMQNTLDHKYERKNGAIVAADYDYNTHAVMEFANALITEMGFPEADAGSKDAAKLTLKFKPEATRYKHAAGHVILGGSKMEQKQWSPANFRLRIDGMEGSTARVSKVEALTIKQTALTDDFGDQRDYQKEPGKLEFPNLKITLAEVYADDFAQWHEEFVIKGDNGQEKEKSGALEFLDATRQKVLLSIDLKSLGIFKFEPDARSTDAEHKRSLPNVNVEMYCNEVQFKFDPK